MKHRNTLIAVFFLTVIFILPAMTLGRRLFAAQEDLASFPKVQTEETVSRNIFYTSHQSIKNALTAFTDRLFFKKQLISINIEVTSFLTGGVYFESTVVLPGKNGWLFYKADTGEEHPIQDYTGVNRYTEEELAQLAANLKYTQDYFLNTWGCLFILYPSPTKNFFTVNICRIPSFA